MTRETETQLCNSSSLFFGHVAFVLVVLASTTSDTLARSENSDAQPSLTLLKEAMLDQDVKSSKHIKSKIVRDIGDLVELDSEYERFQSIEELIANVSEARLVELLRDSEQVQGDTLRLVLQCRVFSQLARQNPTKALVHALEYPDSQQGFYVGSVFNSWGKEDLRSALAYASNLEFPQKKIALEAILQYGTGADLDSLPELASDLEIDIESLDFWQGSIDSNNVDQLNHAWDALLGDQHCDFYQTDLLENIAILLIDLKGNRIVRRLSTSILDLATRSRLLESMLIEISRESWGKGLRPAFRLAVDLHLDQMDKPLIGVVKQWTRLVPSDAFHAVSRIKLKNLRQPLLRIVVNEMAVRNPHFDLFLYINISDELLRWGQSRALASVAREKPRRASQLLETRCCEQIWNDAELETVHGLAEQNLEDALDWVVARAKRKKVSLDLWRVVLSRLASDQPRIAFQTALEQPIDDVEIGPEVVVVSSVAQSNLTLAFELLAEVRKGPTKTVAYQELASELSNPSDLRTAIKLAIRLPISERALFYSILTGAWTSQAPVQPLETVE